MSNWFIEYHDALQLRLLGLVLVFGVLWPAACLLVTAASRLATHATSRAPSGPRIPRGLET
jgi:hypothetical protein